MKKFLFFLLISFEFIYASCTGSVSVGSQDCSISGMYLSSVTEWEYEDQYCSVNIPSPCDPYNSNTLVKHKKIIHGNQGDDDYEEFHYYRFLSFATCDQPDENVSVPLDDNQSMLNFWSTCMTPDERDPLIQDCVDHNGDQVYAGRQNCCVQTICLISSDTNNSEPPDNNNTDPNCPNGQDATGQCCSPGEFVCEGWCQLNGVPCEGDPDGNGTDPNGGGGGGNDDNSTDPCDYPLRNHDLPYRGHSFDQNECFNDAKLFSDVGCDGNPMNASYLKDDHCEWGACYYPNFTHVPDCNDTDGGGGGNDGNSSNGGSNNDSNSSNDNNGTGIDLTDTNKKLDQLHKDNIDQTNKLSDKLTELDGSAKGIKKQVKDSGDQLANVLNALNQSQGSKLNNINDTLKSKLDALNQSIQDKNLSVSVNVENNVSIDLNTTNALLREINSSLSPLSTTFTSHSVNDAASGYIDTIDNAKVIVNDALNSFAQTKNDIIAISQGRSAPTVTASGGCVLSTQVFGTGGEFKIDLNDFSKFRVPVQLILNFILLIMAIRFYIFIGKDIVRHFNSLGGN